ncbi:hypothetical protein IMSAGC015_01452 [Lachnospiraceae bacterium]|nr:hypothetical protein IMSAGC015_01452 [Lachnospiraceae bacterium]
MHRNIRLAGQGRLKRLDCFLVFLLNGNNCFVCLCDLHAVFDTADHFIALFFNLSDIVFEPGLTLSGIDQNITMIYRKTCRKLRIDLRIKFSHLRSRKVDSEFHSRRKSGSSHTNDSGCLHHIKFGSVFRHIDRHELIRLLSCRLNHNLFVCNLRNLTVNT